MPRKASAPRDDALLVVFNPYLRTAKAIMKGAEWRPENAVRRKGILKAFKTQVRGSIALGRYGQLVELKERTC